MNERTTSSPELDSAAFLPICRADMEARGWQQLDFLYSSTNMIR